jgi:O-antigen/teichoic acid export membrane protein
MKRKVIAHILGPGLAALVSFATFPLLAQFYSVSDLGKFSMLQLVANFSVIIFSLGLNQAYVREYYESKKKSALGFNVLVIPIIFMTSFYILFSFLNLDVSQFIFEKSFPHMNLIVFISALSYLFVQMSMHILRMEEKIARYSIFMVMPKVLVLAVSYFFFLDNEEVDFYDLLIAFVIANSAAAFFSFILNKSSITASIFSYDKFHRLNEMLKFGGPLVVGGLGFWILIAMDKIFIKEYSSFEELGLYSVAVSFTAVIALFSTIFLNIYNPLIYKWHADNVSLEKYFTVMRYMLVLCLSLWCLAGMLSWILPLVLPENLKDIEDLFIILIGGPILKLLSESTKIGFGIQRRPSLSIIAIIVACIANGVLNFYLVPLYGATGAAVASLIAFWCLFFVRTEMSARIWVSFPRSLSYVLSIVFVFLSIFIGCSHYFESYLSYIFWFMTLSLILIIFRKLILNLYSEFSTQ